MKKNELPSLQLLQEFESELNKVLNAIDLLHRKEIVVKIFEKDKVISLLKSLVDNLEEDIVQCEMILDSVQPYLCDSYKEFGDNLTHTLDDFDTDSAKFLIEQFLREIDE